MNDLTKHPNLTIRILAALADGPKQWFQLQAEAGGTKAATINRLSKLHHAGVIDWSRRYSRWKLIP